MRPPPPCRIICRAAIWVPKKALFRLTVMTRSYCSSAVSSTEVRVSMPALLTMMSIQPKAATARSTSVCRSPTLATSAATPIELWPSRATSRSSASVTSG
jgi:hypothetical protein